MNWMSILSGTDWKHAIGFSIVSIAFVSLTSVCVARLIRKHATIRDGLLRASLAACLLIPFVGFFSWLVQSPIIVVPVAANTVASILPTDTLASIHAHPTTNTFPPPSVEVPATTYSDGQFDLATIPNDIQLTQQELTQSTDADLISAPTLWTTMIVIWLTGTAILSIFAMRSHRRAWSIRRQAKVVDASQFVHCVQLARHHVGLTRLPLIVESEVIVTPVVHGFHRPAIILPQNILKTITDEELTDVFIHEFAHIYRRDAIIVIAETIARSCLWPIVTVHWLIRELGRSREEVCDNFVLAQRESIVYVETLLKLAEFATGRAAVIPVVGILNWQGKFENRIAGLLDEHRNRSRKLSPIILAPLTLLILLSGIMLSGSRLVAIESEAKSSDKSGQIIWLRIVGADGGSLPGCHVQVSSINETADNAITKNSDLDGKAKFELVPAKYLLTVEPPSDSRYLPMEEQIVVGTDNSHTLEKTITLPLGCDLHFKAIDLDSKEPIPGIKFWTQTVGTVGRTGVQRSPTIVDYPKTDKDGELRANVVPGRRTFGVVFTSDESRGLKARETNGVLAKLLEQLTTEKDIAKNRFLFLLNNSETIREKDGEYTNPLLERQMKLENERDAQTRLLKALNEKLNSIASSMKPETEPSVEIMQSLTIEAEEYLNLESIPGGQTTPLKAGADRSQQVQKIQNKIDRVTKDIEASELERRSAVKVFGADDPKTLRVQWMTTSLSLLRGSLKQELEDLRKDSAAESAKGSDETQKLAQPAKSGVDESSIRIYVLTLEREQMRHEQAIQILDNDLKAGELERSRIRSEIAELNLLKNEIREKEETIVDIMDRLSENSLVASNANPANSFFECRPQTIDCESGKTLRITFELSKKQ